MTSERVEVVEDGRTARRDRNREAVLDAVVELFTEDSLTPTAQDVAERSGVSLRSVYRYYEDLDELARAAIAHHVQRVDPLFELDDLGQGSLDDRIARLVAHRVALYEAIAPTARAALARARSSELIRDQLQARRRRLLEQVRRMFQPELVSLPPGERREVVAALDLLLGFEGVEHLRRQLGFSAAATRRTLTRAVGALLRDR